MKTNLECIPCIIRQSLEAARMTTDDEKKHTEVLHAVMTYLGSISLSSSPPELSRDVHGIIRSITTSDDPYKKVKNASNIIAKNQFVHLEKMVEEAEDPLRMAVKLAIIGNVIDFGAHTRFDVDDICANAMKQDFDDGVYPQFKKSLNTAKTILYLADNTGEIFFDKVLIKELVKKDKEITYVVRAHPIINDATMVDAKFAGIDKLATVIEGDAGQHQSAPGFILNSASKRFFEFFKSSDMVISKGQGNYEGLNDVDRKVFYMLVVKCPLVARDIHSEVGKLLLTVK